MSTKHHFFSLSRTACCALLAASMMLTACGSSAADKTAGGATEQPGEESKAEEVSEQPADNTQDTVTDTAASAGMDTSAAAGDDRAWAEAYLDYLDKDQTEDEPAKYYSLIYVDDDDIPELVVDTGFEAGGCQILTWHGGLLDVLQTSRLYFQYIERGNLLDNCDGHMGYYYDLVYTIHDGRWVQIFNGEYSEFAEDSDPDEDYDEELGRWDTLYYSVNGKETDKDTYYKELNKVFDKNRLKEVVDYLILDDLLSYLKTGKMIYEDHRYELFTEDCTWDEAQKKCEEKGGYLASLTCDGEFEKVEDMIRSEGKNNICFYVGAKRDEYSFEWTEPGLTQRDCVGNPYFKHWLDNGPSYTDTLKDGTEIEEDRVELIYRKNEDCFLLNDIPNDVIGIYPSFAGRMGYICEYAR